jgi:hypothetical protein
LWGDFPVVVRVHSSALEMPANRLGSFSFAEVWHPDQAVRCNGLANTHAVPSIFSRMAVMTVSHDERPTASGTRQERTPPAARASELPVDPDPGQRQSNRARTPASRLQRASSRTKFRRPLSRESGRNAPPLLLARSRGARRHRSEPCIRRRTSHRSTICSTQEPAEAHPKLSWTRTSEVRAQELAGGGQGSVALVEHRGKPLEHVRDARCDFEPDGDIGRGCAGGEPGGVIEQDLV